MHPDKSALLKHILPLAALSPQKLEDMLSLSVPMEHPKGKIIFLAGEQASYFYVILSGWVKLYRETLDGTQAIVDVLPAEHVCGESALFHDNTYPYSAEIAESAALLAIPMGFLEQEIEENPEFAKAMLMVMAKNTAQKERELEHHSIQTAPQRIGCFLLRLLDVTAKGNVTINLPYDKSLIAMRLGMQPETFSRSLAKLKDATGMVIRGSHIELESVAQLSNFCCTACTAEFPCKDLVKGKCGGKA